ncbi:energy transducer TonB [Caulobacter sp. KR2-114]|uniref:energy transducer TonB n=1 Tax=Caulobacter sp. KR2-114 TaxID=3400912 RepID=UPI003C01C1F2
MRRWIPFLVAISIAGQAIGADTKPNWRRRPTPEDLLAVFPHAALQRNIGGKATITCKVAVQGALYDCKVDEEKPAGMGFGDAAIALTPQFLMTPELHDGVAVGGAEVTIPINFAAPGGTLGSRAPSFQNMVPVISNVPWIEAPNYADVVAAYPKKARAEKRGGHVVLDCSFDGQGRMKNCSVIDEDPRGYGFGSAAKSLTARFLGPREDRDGVSLKSATTQIPFTFDVSMLAGDQPVIGKPHWARLPEGSALAAGYPKAATAAHVDSALVTLSCAVGLAGRLGSCTVTGEDPSGFDFGKAALALSDDFQVSVWTPEGLPTVGGRVRVPIKYMMRDAPPDPPAPAPTATAKP